MICGAELETRMARLEAKIDPVSGRTSDERKYAKQPRRSGAWSVPFCFSLTSPVRE